MPTLPPGLPVWAYVLFALAGLIFIGGGAIVWNLRKEIRESRLQPGIEAKQKLENESAVLELAQQLREAQRDALADMRTLLTAARAEALTASAEARAARNEAKEARDEAKELRTRLESAETTYAAFRRRIADWMQQQGYQLPDWWHTQP